MRHADVKEILRIFNDIWEEGNRVAKWWNVVSKMLKKYIIPYIKNLEGRVDEDYLEMIEKENFYEGYGYSLLRRLRYSLFEFSRDILKVIDVLFRAVDPEYRSLRDDDKFGEILLVECELMQDIYKYDERFRDLDILYESGTTGYLIVDGRYLFVTQNIEKILRLQKPMIIVGYRSRISPQLVNLLTSHGYECIRRTINDNVIVLFAKMIKEKTTTG